jgi:hypothetical protein
MRIRRNIIAPVILTIGAIGSLVTVPALAALTATAPATAVVASGTPAPDAIGFMGWITVPGQPPAVDFPSAAGRWLSLGGGVKLPEKSREFS